MFDKERGLYIAHCANGALSITGKMANRHGLIAGATGTGKTVTLQVMAETFCQAGVPCFMADMKGDLSGISQVGRLSGFIEKRLPEFGIENPEFQSCPVRFFDVFGEQGHPMRATVSQMGPQLLSRLMQLNETQDGVLNIVFRIADERGVLIDDIKDLRAMLDWVSKHAKEYTTKYGNISTATVGAIQRALLQLESQGADRFFGLPSFDIYDLLQTEGGKGIMNVLAADKLMLQPKLYSTFLLWLLSELYTTLPEVGDLPLPKLVFFFDEAHMLFTDTSKALLDKIEQVIRLIRSKGVGIYFITQSPTDIPENILGQLGNRVQHALRAYTPKDQKAVKTAADTFRANPDFKTDEAIMNLETGEALVSFLDEKGAPAMVERAKDDRAIFWTDGQTVDVTDMGEFTNGIGFQKYKNRTSDGGNGVAAGHPDTDFPMFRYADVLLMAAECGLNNSASISSAEGLGYLNQVRARAGLSAETSLSVDKLLDERARELYLELWRRQDLIRYNRFTTADYLWQWKGGVHDGQAVESYKNLYPIPVSDMMVNPNLEQNDGYKTN